VATVQRHDSRLMRAATRPVSSSSLAVVRIAFGVGVFVNCLLYLPVLVHDYYVATTFNFPYGELTFVQALPGYGMHLVYVALATSGILVALGYRYRISAGALFVLTTYIFLVDSTYFQNHEYLISLLALLFWMLPLHCRWSLDARRDPSVESSVLPAWMVWLVRFQIGVPYFFGAVAKINSDWLAGEPLRMWLANRTDIEPINAVLTNETVVWIMAYGSLLLDLVIVAMLLYRPTRVVGFVIITIFHLTNVWLWGLFIFPWLMIAATTIFFDPDWPERALVRWHAWRGSGSSAKTPAASAASGAASDDHDRLDESEVDRRDVSESAPRFAPWSSVATWGMRGGVAVFVIVWVATQTLLPWRHYLIDGSPNWTEQAHRFAWHMKLRDKQGSATFHVTTQDGRTFTVDPADHLNA
jgi:vitamin K-dependent gamma-carboxylase